MSFFKHVQLHKYDLTDKGVAQACYDEMRAEGYDMVITEKEMQVLATHSCEEVNIHDPCFTNKDRKTFDKIYSKLQNV